MLRGLGDQGVSDIPSALVCSVRGRQMKQQKDMGASSSIYLLMDLLLRDLLRYPFQSKRSCAHYIRYYW